MTTFAYSSQSPTAVRADVLVLPVFEGPEPGPGVREVKGVDLMALWRDAALTGKRGEQLLVPNAGNLGVAASSVLLLGVGKRAELKVDDLRRAAGKVARQLAKRGAVATTLAQALPRSSADAVQAVVEGQILGAYRFERYKTSSEEGPDRLETYTVLGSPRWDARACKAAIARAEVVGASVCFTRDLVNTPARDLTPAALADAARAMAEEVGLEVKIWDERELEEGGFGGILGVGQGSVNPPRLIELAYRGAASQPPIALTGKGISFDSGGLSIKTSEGMETMKDDMGGAAAILGAMRAIALLKPKLNVIAAIPSAENMPSGSATRPGDVLRHRGGKTSEVLNTDAEGRLVLADALAYLTEKRPRAIVDAATLTGACMVALGEELWGLFTTDRALGRALLSAGESVGEPGWELPLYRPYRKLIDSEVADVKNVGKRYGGAITAALFLAEFVGDVPWAHLDIAGPAFTDSAGDYWPKGATGVPVRTLVAYLLDQAKPR
ncbi:MAG: putative cytosol aminopeptidase [Actinomycetota bacterium]|nr:MAG: putative cytosol aminopeptidase [Actinomycetota bacterium]